MFNVFLLIMNFVFSVLAGVVCAVVVGWDWWWLTFFVGFVLWNVVIGSIILFVGFVLTNTETKGE